MPVTTAQLHGPVCWLRVQSGFASNVHNVALEQCASQHHRSPERHIPVTGCSFGRACDDQQYATQNNIADTCQAADNSICLTAGSFESLLSRHLPPM